MPTDGYMDAAAVPVPDAGNDTLREQVADARTRFDAASEDHPTVEAEEAFTDHCKSDMGFLFDGLRREQQRAKTAEAERDSARNALAEIVRERNDWGRRLADAADEARSALNEADEARRARAQAENERTALTVRAEDAEAAVAAAVQAERERLAQNLEARAPSPGDAYHRGEFMSGVRSGLVNAADIVRSGGSDE